MASYYYYREVEIAVERTNNDERGMLIQRNALSLCNNAARNGIISHRKAHRVEPLIRSMRAMAHCLHFHHHHNSHIIHFLPFAHSAHHEFIFSHWHLGEKAVRIIIAFYYGHKEKFQSLNQATTKGHSG